MAHKLFGKKKKKGSLSVLKISGTASINKLSTDQARPKIHASSFPLH